MQSVALFLALRPKLYPILFGSVPCQPTNEDMLVSAKPLLRQLILQLAGKNAGFLNFRIVFFRVVASEECNLKRVNVSPLRGRSRQFSSDAGDGLDLVVTTKRAFDATTRTHQTSAQYPLLQRRVSESTISNAEYFVAFDEEALVGSLDINSDASGAGFGVTERGKGKQQASGNQGFHRAHSFCFGFNLSAALEQYNLG
jgi:hypothetical protein